MPMEPLPITQVLDDGRSSFRLQLSKDDHQTLRELVGIRRISGSPADQTGEVARLLTLLLCQLMEAARRRNEDAEDAALRLASEEEIRNYLYQSYLEDLYAELYTDWCGLDSLAAWADDEGDELEKRRLWAKQDRIGLRLDLLKAEVIRMAELPGAERPERFFPHADGMFGKY